MKQKGIMEDKDLVESKIEFYDNAGCAVIIIALSVLLYTCSHI